MNLVDLPGVFTPHSDSWRLAAAARREQLGRDATALDVCTGSGVVAIAAAERASTVTAVDVSWRALAVTWVNARRNRSHVRLRHGHLFDPVGAERFDLITANPPYVPTAEDELPRRGRARAWAAGRDGRLVLDAICDAALGHLRPGGVLLVVHSSLNDDDATVERLSRAGFADARVTERHLGPLGPLMVAQQRLGHLPGHLDEEAVVIVRAVAGD